MFSSFSLRFSIGVLAAFFPAVSSFGAVITGGTATESSVYGVTQFPASNAIDGDFSNFSHTDSGDRNASLTYDLPGATDYLIDTITLFNRAGCCGERLRDITVSVLAQDGVTPVYTSSVLNQNNGLAFTGVSDGSSNPNAANAQDIVLTLPGGIQGGFVKVSRAAAGNAPGNDDTNVLALGELQVSGTVVPEPTSLTLIGIGAFGLLARRRR